jgi:thymidylate synthase ThyX
MYETKIILDSIAPSGGRLTTFQITLPRIVLAEFNTHRMFSRNSASSRAIPVEKMISRVTKDPFIPTYFGKNQKGMQAENELDEVERVNAKNAWQEWIRTCLKYASIFKDLGLHKQLANRVLESVNWHTIVCSATEYENYFGLRDNPQAAPEIRDSAHEAQELYKKSEPNLLEDGGFHLPYVAGKDYDLLTLHDAGFTIKQLCEVSIGRCAAVTYLNQENVTDPNGDIDRATKRLLPSGHMSPFEHVAESLDHQRWRQIAREQANEWIEHRIPMGNFWGWLQYRKTLKNEHNFKLITKG